MSRSLTWGPSPSPGPSGLLFNISDSDMSGVRSPSGGPSMGPSSLLNLTTLSEASSSRRSCDSGCIAASVIGSVLGFVILVMIIVLLWRCCRRNRSSKASVTSQVDLLEDSISSAQGLKLCHQHFDMGDKVFCKDLHTAGACPVGSIISHAGNDLYKVQLQDGVVHLMRNSHMAPHFQSDASVRYMPPDGSEGINCTIISADGSYWPPFYHLRPDNSSLDSINTTAEHLLTTSGKIHYGNDIIASAV